MNLKQRKARNNGIVLHGYLLGKFPGNVDRNKVNIFKTMNLLNLDWFERFFFILGYNKGCFDRREQILLGKWIKIGGVYGPIPSGTTAEDWIGSESIARMSSKPSERPTEGF